VQPIPHAVGAKRIVLLCLVGIASGGCSSDFWDRSPGVGGEYSRRAPYAEVPYQSAPQQQPYSAPSQPRYQSQATPAPDAPPPNWGEQQRPSTRTPVAPAPTPAPYTSPDTAGATQEDLQVLARVNQIRRSRGLRALAWNSQLHVAAYEHSQEQQTHGYMGHGSPDPARDQLGERIQLAGYDGSAWAEVVAWGYRDVNGVVQGWMDSPPHRKILIDPELTEAAFSRAGLYWTGNFGTPRRRPAPRRAPATRYRTQYRAQPAPQAQPRRAPQTTYQYRQAPRQQPAPPQGTG
jgi:uncharacterized protein YkwD